LSTVGANSKGRQFSKETAVAGISRPKNLGKEFKADPAVLNAPWR